LIGVDDIGVRQGLVSRAIAIPGALVIEEMGGYPPDSGDESPKSGCLFKLLLFKLVSDLSQILFSYSTVKQFPIRFPIDSPDRYPTSYIFEVV